MEVFNYHDIPRSVLATLIDYQGDTSGPISPRPLMGQGSPVTKHMLAELFSGDFVELPTDGAVRLTPQFKNVVEVLQNPVCTVNLRIWGGEGKCVETSLLFPSDLSDGSGVGLNQIDNIYKIVAPLHSDHIIDILHPVLPPASPADKGLEFEGNFDGPVAAVLFGMMDLARLGTRKTYSAEDIYGYLDGQWGLTGFNNLVSYAMTVGLMPTPPSLMKIEHCLRLLVECNLLSLNSKGMYGLKPSMKDMISIIPEDIAGIQWQRVSQDSDEGLLYSHHIFLICKGGNILDLSPSVGGRIFISCCHRDDLVRFLVDELSFIHLAPEKKHEQDEKPLIGDNQACPSCGKIVSKDKKFCSHCGELMACKKAESHASEDHAASDFTKNTTEQSVICPECGVVNERGKKFCTSCGASAAKGI